MLEQREEEVEERDKGEKRYIGQGMGTMPTACLM